MSLFEQGFIVEVWEITEDVHPTVAEKLGEKGGQGPNKPLKDLPSMTLLPGEAPFPGQLITS